MPWEVSPSKAGPVWGLVLGPDLEGVWKAGKGRHL